MYRVDKRVLLPIALRHAQLGCPRDRGGRHGQLAHIGLHLPKPAPVRFVDRGEVQLVHPRLIDAIVRIDLGDQPHVGALRGNQPFDRRLRRPRDQLVRKARFRGDRLLRLPGFGSVSAREHDRADRKREHKHDGGCGDHKPTGGGRCAGCSRLYCCDICRGGPPEHGVDPPLLLLSAQKIVFECGMIESFFIHGMYLIG